MARSSVSDPSIEEQKSFLPHMDSEDYLACQHCSNRTISSTGSLSRWMPWILNFCLTLALIFAVTFPTSHRFNALEHSERLDILSPAKGAVEHILYKFDSGFDPHISPYQGFPNDDKDKLWSELYAYGMTLAISEEEQLLLPDPGEKFPIEGHEHEYVVGLDVFHELHCLNHLRMAFYPRHYNMSMVKPDGSLDQSRWMHVDHCIESLRQSLICNADVSVVNFKWHDSSKIMEPVMENTHQCRNFSRIQEFAKERWVRLPHKRLHVESDGHIADYSDYANPEDIPLETLFPGFNHTVDDL